MAHAYFIIGGQEEGIARAMRFAEAELGLAPQGDPDLVVLRYGLFAVEDARKLMEASLGSPVGGAHKAVIVAASRIFHEAQNALLKLFEEPPQGVTLILVLPAEGVLLPTLRSRLLALPADAGMDAPKHGASRSGSTTETADDLAQAFLAGSDAEREKLIAKLVDRSKSDKDEEKQGARADAVRLAEGLIRTLDPEYRQAKEGKAKRELQATLDDLTHFLPLLHTRSAPLKLIFEHVRLTLPTI